MGRGNWQAAVHGVAKSRALHVVQSLSPVWRFATPWIAECQASLFFTISWSLLKLTSIELMMPFNHLILCYPLLLLTSSISSIRVFSNEQSFALGGQSLEASALASVLPMNSRGWFPLGLTGFISLLSKGLSRVFSSTSHHYILNGILDILILVSWFMQNLFSPYSEQMWNFKQLYSMDRGA